MRGFRFRTLGGRGGNQLITAHWWLLALLCSQAEANATAAAEAADAAEDDELDAMLGA